LSSLRTQGPILRVLSAWALKGDAFRNYRTGGYGSLLSQGRQRLVWLAISEYPGHFRRASKLLPPNTTARGRGFEAIIRLEWSMIRKSGNRFSLGTNAKRLPGDHAQTKK
jgi:hypothetical protein